ncbi:MAG: hypothetical protein HY678_11210 [Chloroflexi bacterium]|nr:hypothetical protein [Chloroflexota bacterium]
MATRHPGPAEAIAPVVRELEARGHEVTLLGASNGFPEWKRHGGSAAVFSRVGLTYLDVAEIWAGGDPGGMPDLYGSQLTRQFRPDRILVGCPADPLGTDVGIEEVLLAAATEACIPSVQFIESWDVWSVRKNGSLAERFAVIDKHARAVLRTRGVPANRIAITGHPGFDALIAENGHAVGRLEHGAAASAGRRIVYFASALVAGNSPDDLLGIEWVAECAGVDDVVIFRRHPRDQRDYTEVFRKYGDRIIEPTYSGEEALRVAQVAVTHFSTMGVKAALLGIPTINILLDDDIPDVRTACGGYPLSLIGASTEVHSRAQLREVLSHPPAANPRAAIDAFRLDGMSAARVCSMIAS